MTPSDAATTTIGARATGPALPPGAPSVGGPHQRTGESSMGKEDPPITRGGWVWPDFE
jgi:hypothetical protein